MHRDKRTYVPRPVRRGVSWILAAGLLAAWSDARAAAQLPTVNPGVSPKLPGPAPKVPLPPIEIDNWGFEHGLTGWEKTGDAFDHQPTLGNNVAMQRVTPSTPHYKMPLGGDYWKQLGFPIGHKGAKWIGTYEKRPTNTGVAATQGDGPRGTLTSKAFVADKRFITFLIGGGKDLARLKVELLERADGGTLTLSDGRYRPLAQHVKTGGGHELMRREWFDVGALRGKTLRIRIVDDSSAGWGHINVDDFQFQDTPPPLTLAPATVGGAMVRPHQFIPGDASSRGFVDWDAPVWGVADLHTHPAAHLGFGKMLLQGAPDGDIARELGNCNIRHGGWGMFDNTQGNTLRSLVVGMLDEIYVHRQGLEKHMDHPHEGFPKFQHWPHFTTVTHQQMRVEWLRRAHEGGLRVIVALAVNNHLLAAAIDGEQPHDDKASANEQIAYIKKFVGDHDFMAIARTPAQLREIVREGKLAVILGMEVDNIGNFNFAGVDRSDAAVRAEIRRLHGLGVRYMFPIHVTDNHFGGAAVYSDMFNLANRFAAVQPSPPTVGAMVPNTAYRIEHAPDPLVKFKLAPLLPSGAIPPLRLLATLVQAAMGPLGAVIEAEPEFRIIRAYFLTADPATDGYAKVAPGHRNVKSLSRAGEVALREMMRLGMLIDIDHSSEKTVEELLRIAEAVPGKYPLQSGHNGFRAMRSDATENQRSDRQLERILALGGMMGVGYGYEKDEGKTPSFAQVIASRGGQAWTRSRVEASCGGSSRRFAQNYLYALEKMAGGDVALGTDINGLFPGPGPRFGEMSRLDGNRCAAQSRPVHYTNTVVAQAPGEPASITPANEPLVPLQTGQRRWSYNTDGMVHYGMLPDFFQDLANIGVVPADLDPLFSSAEHLARTWDKALRVAPAG